MLSLPADGNHPDQHTGENGKHRSKDPNKSDSTRFLSWTHSLVHSFVFLKNEQITHNYTSEKARIISSSFYFGRFTETKIMI